MLVSLFSSVGAKSLWARGVLSKKNTSHCICSLRLTPKICVNISSCGMERKTRQHPSVAERRRLPEGWGGAGHPQRGCPQPSPRTAVEQGRSSPRSCEKGPAPSQASSPTSGSSQPPCCSHILVKGGDKGCQCALLSPRASTNRNCKSALLQ